MNKSVAQKSAPPVKGKESPSQAEQTAYQRSLFFSSALNMSWQLAVVVLVPVIGGHFLDEHLDSAPLWTIVGFVVAVAAASLVVWRQSQLLSPKISNDTSNKERRR